MMTNKKHILTTLLLICVLACGAISLNAKDKNTQKDVYLFGMSASFNDSTVYFTDIQHIAPAYFTPKTKFLHNRDGFSSQLGMYMKELSVENPTCITFFSQSQKKLQKKYAKVTRKYDASLVKEKKKTWWRLFSKKPKKKNNYVVKYLSSEQFSYQSIAFDEGTVFVDAYKAEKAARKSAKKEKKAQKKESKKALKK